ncbi:MAG: carotenoid oxygenase [Ilumatobacter sp.]|nr:carotenoid oxygenase family protein [bacterium]NKB41016.1 carotenoid oxygenase [Ilumatobacter sp.]
MASWQSDNPHLRGAFAPVSEEVEEADLEVIAGQIPPELCGAYMRNGPNPQFAPISYTYPLEGDGMVHAVYFSEGRARYKNRYVRTRAFEIERAAGRAVFGGIMSPVPIDPKLLSPSDDPENLFKEGAFIGLVHHDQRLFALGEVEPAYEMTMELETVGKWTAGTTEPVQVGAHTRLHPGSQELFALAYDLVSPQVSVHCIDANANLKRTFQVTLPAPSMIHDFVLTNQYLVLVIGPAVWDFQAAMQGGEMLQWRPELGTHIGVVPLDGGPETWIEADPFFVFHFANGFERGSKIIVDFVEHERLNVGTALEPHQPPHLQRMMIDPQARTVARERLVDDAVEFPRINDHFVGRENRFIYVPTLTDTLLAESPPSASFNCLIRVDTETGTHLRHDFGNRFAGEAVFIGRESGEDEGYLATFLDDQEAGTTDLALLDAADIEADPVALIRMPQRVPQGLHGIWVPDSK